MCVYSMAMDWKYDEWFRRYQFEPLPPQPYVPWTPPFLLPPLPEADERPMPSQEEIDEFYRLLEKARKYDAENGEPECETEQKKEKLRKLAKELGVEIVLP